VSEFQIGINADSSTLNGSLDVLRNLLDRFKEAGFTAVEIPVHGLECILRGILRKTRTREVRKILESYPFSYTVHGPDPLNLTDPFEPDIHDAALRASIEFTREIGATLVVYHGSFLTTKRSVPVKKSDIFKEEVDRLKAAGEYAEKNGVILAVENIFRQRKDEYTYRINPKDLARVIGAVDSPSVGICFDFGHAYISAHEEGFSFIEAVRAALPYLVHVHIHDNFGVPNPNGMKPLDAFVLGMGDLHLPPGWGTIPYKDIFPEVLTRYSGVFLFELQPRFSDHYEDAIQWARGIRMNGNLTKP